MNVHNQKKLVKSDVLLANHIVYRRGIYPAVAYLDLVFDTLFHHDPTLVDVSPMRVLNGFWNQPLLLEEGENEKEIGIKIGAVKGDHHYQVESRGPAEPAIHAAGIIQVERNPKKRVRSRKPDQIAHRLPETLSASEIYPIFDQTGIRYRGPFRCIEQFHFDSREAFSRIHLTEKIDGRLNPIIMDGLMQTILLHLFQGRKDTAAFVPFSFREMCVYRFRLPEHCCAHVKKIKAGGQEDAARFDARLYDEKGKILVEVKDICMKAFPRSIFETSTVKSGKKLAVAATFTAEPIREALSFWLEKIKLNYDIEFAPYNQIFQEMLNPHSLLSQNREGINFLMLRLEDLARQRPGSSTEADSREKKEELLKGRERYRLGNGLEIAHLNGYETRYLYNEIFQEQTYLKHDIRLNPGDVVIDIGANIGMFSLFVRQCCQDVQLYSFEPSPVTFEVLKTNLRLHVPGAVACNCGIAGEDTTAEFTFYPHSSVFSGFHCDQSEDREAIGAVIENAIREKGIFSDEVSIKEYAGQLLESRLQRQNYTCELKRLSTVIKEFDIRQVDLLKVDAEKCEWDILMGLDEADWKKIKQIVVEVHGQDKSLYKKVCRLLRQKGFQLEVVEEKLLEGSGLFNIYARRPGIKADASKSRFQEDIEDTVSDLLEILRSRSAGAGAPLIVCLCPPSPEVAHRFGAVFLDKLAMDAAHVIKGLTNVYCLDISSFKSIYSFDDFYDGQRDRLGHIPYTQEFFATMATIVARRLYALNTRPGKVVILDCDNTLWKGVCGEVGAGGVEIGPAFQYLQQFMVRQHQAGVLLCLASKNQIEDVKQVFDSREDMVLKWDHLSAARVNWQRKSENIISLAAELNLGVDSMIFIDDNPVECAEVKAACPEVLTLQLPGKEEIREFLDHTWAFDHWEVTEADRQRATFYKQNQEREAFRQSTLNFRDFIEKLDLDIRVSPPEPSHINRISQLTIRTNQFNFTTIRRKESEITALLEAGDHFCRVVHVADRFGDYGLVGVLIVKEESADLLVDTFLLSCRVLGRGVEHRMLSELGKMAESKGKKRVVARYIETEKNEPARNFLLEAGGAYKGELDRETRFNFPAEFLAEFKFVPPESADAIHTGHKKAKKSNVKKEEADIIDKSLFFTDVTCKWRDGRTVLETLRFQKRGRAGTPVEKAISRPPGETAVLPEIRPVLDSDPRQLEKYVRECVVHSVAGILQVGEGDLDPDVSFKDFGIKSMEGISLIAELNNEFDILLPVTCLYDYSCIADLTGFILENYEAAVRQKVPRDVNQLPAVNRREISPVSEAETAAVLSGRAESRSTEEAHIRPTNRDIAVIGMSGRFPGGHDLEEFWEMLAGGRSAVHEVPRERWDWRLFYDPDPEKPEKTYCKWGGFLEDIDRFDALFFNISGKEAALADPQQRLFLEESWRALEDAGYAHNGNAAARCGVYVGTGSGDYQHLVRQAGIEADASVFTGTHPAILASRLSYFLNLKGPSMVVETACSSSLVAVHIACEAIIGGEIDMALAGGVFINTTPGFHILASKSKMLSKEGCCKTFDDDADGFVPGEGVGVVVLRPLGAAEKEDDHIYGVIKTSAVNQDGKTNGIMAPSAASQTEVEVTAYRKGNINPEHITYIEAHGTGTRLGDPIEVEALTRAFGNFTRRRQYCAIGSVKTNIGHAANAAGIAGLIKVLLCLKYKKLVPSLNYKQGNQYIDFSDSHFFVSRDLQDWRGVDSRPRTAAVSSFGFSGTNCHIVVEEYPDKAVSTPAPEPRLFVLSAKNEECLKVYVGKMAAFLDRAYAQPSPVGEPKGDGAYHGKVEEGLRIMLAEILQVDEADIGVEDDFSGYGLEPIHYEVLTRRLNREHHLELLPADISGYSSIRSLGDYLDERRQNVSLTVDTMSPPPSLADITYTLQLCRQAMEERLAVTVSGIDELKEKLSRFCRGESEIENLHRGNIKKTTLLSELQELGIEMELLTGSLVETRQFNRLARLWTLGVAVDWRLLYPGTRPRRVSLPTYPFSSRRYWVEDIKQLATVQDVRKNRADSHDETTADESALSFYRLRWHPSPLPEEHLGSIKISTAYADDGSIVLVAAPAQCRGIDRHISAAHGAERVVLIELGNRTRRQSRSHWSVDIEDPSAFDICLEQLRNIHAVYFLGGIQSGRIDIQDLDAAAKRREYGVISLFRLVKSLIRYEFDRHSIELKVITNNVQPVTPGETTVPHAASIYGFLRSLAKEYPRLKMAAVDIDLEELDEEVPVEKTPDLVKSILAEPFQKPGREIALRGGQRYEQRIEPVLLPPAAGTPFREEGVYLIVGGAGGIGLELSRYLARTVRARLVLVGRSPLSIRQKEKISAIEAAGGKVLYLQADAGDPGSMTTVVARARASFGNINGAVHSAIVLQDKTLENMDESTFRAALRPKTEGSLVLYKVLTDEPLDFMMFFSSAQSFTGYAGQSNYAAACTFKDAVAGSIRQIAPYPVKVINWGYWGSVGIVASEEYQERMASRGFQSITPPEGMEAMRRILSQPVDQVIALKGEPELLESLGIVRHYQVEFYPECIPSVMEVLTRQVDSILKSRETAERTGYRLHFEQALIELETLSRLLLLKTLRKMGVFGKAGETYDSEDLRTRLGVVPAYFNWYNAILDILERAEFITISNRHIIAADRLEQKKFRREMESIGKRRESLIERFPETAPYIALLTACLNEYPGILGGRKNHMEVMFPQASLELVERIYRGNPLSDFYNHLAARIIKAFLQSLLRNDRHSISPVRILEVGAGTGGTSAFVLEAIKMFADKIRYVYTDISMRFIQHGRQIFAAGYRFVEFKVFDVENSPEEQGFEPGTFDLIIATNVIHATRCIDHTLNQVKKLLRRGGILVLNEITRRLDFNTLTFGLTSGWWSFEDESNRIKGSPLLTPEKWQQLLGRCGFHNILLPVVHPPEEGEIIQNIIVAESDGQVVVMRAEPGTKPQQAEVESPARRKLPDDPDELIDCLEMMIRELVAETLRFDPSEVAPELSFQDFGVDSLLAVDIVNKINERFKSALRSTDLFNYATVRKLSIHLVKDLNYVPESSNITPDKLISRSVEPLQHLDITRDVREASKPITVSSHINIPGRNDDIAIIGMAGRFPGAENTDEFWSNLAAGQHSITEVPGERWSLTELPEPDIQKGARWGAFVADIDLFDPLFFNISPREAEFMDPQQRLFLQEAWRAIEDAGISGKVLDEKRCGVFVGCKSGDYLLKISEVISEPEAYSFCGNASSILPARISYYLNLKGPALSIDTACSSSLVAVHMAFESIRSGTSDLAVAGGVEISVTPRNHLLATVLGMASPDGRCKTFDDAADGFVTGEGVGVVVMKELTAALDNRDHIYGVIRGSGINQDGRTSGITAPSAASQTALECEVYDKYGINPETITFIETHGTGTILGDPIEIDAISDAFGKYTTRKQFCAVGSVKTNIGHTLAAAGVAGLIKVLLAFKHKQIPPSLNYEKPNRHINFDDSPFYVNTQLEEWQTGMQPRRAAVSSFGFSGTNAHVVLEEAPAAQPDLTGNPPPCYLVPLSARTPDALERKFRDLLEWLAGGVEESIGDIAYTLQAGRDHFQIRSALIVTNIQDLEGKIRQLCQQEDPEDCLKSSLKGATSRREPAMKELAGLLSRELESGRELPESEYRSKLLTLADLYVKGYKPDWRSLQGGGKYRMISLPTYPFARERYWIPAEKSASERSNRKPSARLHPLLDRNSSNLREQRYSTCLTGDEFYLTDHVIGREKVFPGVSYLEMARAAAELAGERPVLKLFNLVWASPLTVTEGEREVHIALIPEKQRLTFEVYTQDPDDGRQVHAQGQLVYHAAGGESEFDSSALGKVIDLDALRERCRVSYDRSHCYRMIDRQGIHYGPSFQTIETMYCSDEEALAELVLPASLRDGFNSFVLHPSMLDGALQTVSGLLNVTDPGSAFVPFTVREVHLFKPMTERCFAHASCVGPRPESSGESGLRKFNIELVDESGQLLVRIEDFAVRPFLSRQDTEEPMCFDFKWVQTSPPATPGSLTETGPVLVFDTEESRCLELRERLGTTVILVRPAAKYKMQNNQSYFLHPGRPEDYLHLLETLKQQQQLPGCIIHLWSQAPFGGYETDLDAHLEVSLYSLYYLSQALLTHHPGDILRILYLYPDTQDNPQPLYAAVCGFARSLRHEHSRLICRTVSVTDPGNIVEIVTAEYYSEAGMEISYRDGRRWLKRWQEVELPSPAGQSSLLKKRGVYLITGGTGGLGLLFADYLARTQQARLVLCDCFPLNEEKRARLKNLEYLGAEVVFLQADVSKPHEVEKLLEEAKSRFNHIDGILHAAGVNRDAFLLKKNSGEITAVLMPKVHGTLNLDEATKQETLDFFVMFSSIAGVLGNVGQSDYAYANSFMDNFARWRERLRKKKRRSGKTMSINWPLWEGGGMQVDEQKRQWLARTMGMQLLQPEAGLDVFNRGMALDVTQLLVMTGDHRKIRQLLEPYRPTHQLAESKSTASGPGEDTLFEHLQQDVLIMASAILKVKIEDLDPDIKISEYGFDSISFTEFANRLNNKFMFDLTPAIFFEHPTIGSFSQYLHRQHGEFLSQYYRESEREIPSRATTTREDIPEIEKRAAIELETMVTGNRFSYHTPAVEKVEPSNHHAIAIIGMSGLMPQSEDLESFWSHLVAGHDLITEIPNDRWDWQAYYGDPTREANKTRVRWGGFLKDVDKFDSLFFGISPREAELMDPQHRLFLEVAWKTIEDAGYKAEDLSDTRTGVFVGGAKTDYFELLCDHVHEVEAHTSIGMSHSLLANRVSYFFNLHGPSEPIDTACSSALVAINRAVEAIRTGSCDMAIAGGVNVILTPTLTLSFSKAGMLSEDGRCKTFDARANGYVRGEGCGAILLKPVTAAEPDGDHIYALIVGTAENHGGHSASLTAPNPNAQAQLLINAYENSGIDPRTVSYIETHGTGTSLGDPIEINGLKLAFTELYRRIGQSFPTEPHCALGSVKTNIGHLETAAGIAGLFKVLLSMRHRHLPGNLHFEKLNPFIQLQGTPFHVLSEGRAWERLLDEEGRSVPLRAGISSFGFGGANAHVIVEEYEAPEVQPSESDERGEAQLIVLSARSEERLQAYAVKLAKYLDRERGRRSAPDRGTEEGKQPLGLNHELSTLLGELLGVDPADIKPADRLSDYGLDGVGLSELERLIHERFELELPPSILSLDTVVRDLARHLDRPDHAYRRGMAIDESEDSGFRHPHSDLRLMDVAYTLQVGREPLEERLALVVSSVEEMREKLHRFCRGDETLTGCCRNNTKRGGDESGNLIEGRAGEEYMRVIIEDRDLDKIGRLWTTGVRIDWPRLYRGITPRRISLPTYPFARKRFWIKADSFDQHGTSGILHPLIDRIDPGFSLEHRGVVFRKTFKSTDLILRHHQVRKQPILPGVGYLEMAYAAGKAVSNGSRFNLARTVWLQPLVVANGKQDVQVVLEKKGDQHLRYRIQSGENSHVLTHASGELRMAGSASEQRISLSEVKSRCNRHVDKTTLYRRFADAGIGYGDYFQGLNEVWGNGTEALGRIAISPGYESEVSRYSLHPALLDSALQTVAGILMTSDNGGSVTKVPFSMEEVELLHPLPCSGYAYVKSLGGDRFHGALTDDDGKVCLKFHDFTIRELPDSLEQLFYVPCWQAEPLGVTTGQASVSPSGSGRVLIVYTPESTFLADGLSSFHSGNEVFKVCMGRSRQQGTGFDFEIRDDDAEGFSSIMERVGSVDILYFLHLHSGEVKAVEAAAEWSPELGVVRLFRLVKSMLGQGLGSRSLDIKVVTNGVYRVWAGDGINPFSAGLVGFSRSLMREYGWWVSCIDIDSTTVQAASSGDGVEELVVSIVPERSELVALRGGGRYVQVIEPLRLTGADESVFRRGGVYMIVGGSGGIGLELSRYLARRVSARLVLVGRSHLSESKRNKIEEIESLGGEVLYVRGDIGDIDSMREVVSAAKERFGRINGVVHSAIVLQDKTVENMDEGTLRAVLAPKVQGSVVLHRLFAGEELDFMMFFSSAQSFTCNAGQSNYAAGCTFKDAYASYIGEVESYPVKIINWGYWGSVGVVSGEDYNRRLAQQGVGSIEPEEGMEALERVLGKGGEQVLVIKGDDRFFNKLNIDRGIYRELYPELTGSVLPEVMPAFELPEVSDRVLGRLEAAFGELSGFCCELLLYLFQRLGVFLQRGESYEKSGLRSRLGIVPGYERLFGEFLCILKRGGLIEFSGDRLETLSELEGLVDESALQEKRDNLMSDYPELCAYLRLLWSCSERYPEILRGEVPATDVMFPHSSMDLVEGIYRDNAVADYFNDLVARFVGSYMQVRLPRLSAGEKVTILEVGAGTGGTSRGVLEVLSAYRDHVRYIYTDVSVGFTHYGREHFGGLYDFVEFGHLNIEEEIISQGYEGGSVDVIIGANVVHATRLIRESVNNLKVLLKRRGCLLLNEVTCVQSFSTLTFGLLEGWWLYEDEENRIPGSPLLSFEMWSRLLRESGFDRVEKLSFGELNREVFVQEVLVGESNGEVRRVKESPEFSLGRPVSQPLTAELEVVESGVQSVVLQEEAYSSQLDTSEVEDVVGYVEEAIVTSLVEVLQIESGEFDRGASYTDFGVDSILAVEIINKLNDRLGIELRTTDLFNYPTIQNLRDHVIEDFSDKIAVKNCHITTKTISPGDSMESLCRKELNSPTKEFIEFEVGNSRDTKNSKVLALFRKLEQGELKADEVEYYLEQL